MKQDVPLLLATEDSFFADLIASTVGAGHRVVPAYGNVKQTIDLMTSTGAELLLLCYNDIGRSERFYLDFTREMPQEKVGTLRCVVMTYRGHEAQASQLCHRYNLQDYVIAGPTLDVQRLHYVLRPLTRSKDADRERNELQNRLNRASQLLDGLVDLQQPAEGVGKVLETLGAAVPPELSAAIGQLLTSVEAATKATRSANLLGKRSILVVDDDPLLREICASGLEASGYHVFEAGDAPEGIRLLEQDKVDLILMDLMLPGLDGIAATRKIRAIPRCKSIPVLMLTGHSDPETVKTCGQAGANGFIVKPVDQGALVEKVRKHLTPA